MNRAEFVKNIEDSYTKALEILKKKNSDYAVNDDPFRNFNFSEIIGITPERAILARVVDKLARVNVLLDKDPDVKDEAIEDTLLDIINYMAILKAKIESND